MTVDKPQPDLDRRPIAARELRTAQRLTAWLVRRRVHPNAISVAGMIAGVGAGLALAATSTWPDHQRALWLLGAALVPLRLLANMLDGMVAVGAGQASPVGELYNEVPDRVSDTATLVGLGYALGGVAWLGYVAALLAILTAYVRAVGKAAGASSDFRGPMAKQQRMFLVTVTALFLAVAPASWHPAFQSALVPGLPALVLVVVIAGSAWTAVRRLRGIARELRKAGA